MGTRKNQLAPVADVSRSGVEVYRFGSFELQTYSGLLLRNGSRIRIEDLPLRMLEGLLERPGQIFSREELRNTLWGNDEFGDFDNRLNVAARKLREALTDPQDGSQFVETVRGRGYRFAGEVIREVVPVASFATATSPSRELLVDEPAEPLSSAGLSLWPRRVLRLTHPLAGWLIGFAFFLGAALFLTYRYLHRPLLGEHHKIALGAFVNSTGDSAYDGVLFSALQTKLLESPYLTLISRRSLRGALNLPAAPTLADEERACSHLGGNILVSGEIAGRPSGYELLLTARTCDRGRTVASVKTYANSQREVLAALDTASEQMRSRLGESDASIRRFNVPIGQATTSSLAALRAFTMGEQKRLVGQEEESISDYALAVDLDPQFAIAFARLGTVYMNLGEDVQSRRYYQKAFDLRERTNDWERLYITSHYYGESTGQIRNAMEADQVWHAIYPRDESPIYNLAINHLALGEPAPALEEARLAVSLDPSLDMPQSILAEAYLRSGDYKSLASVCGDPASANNGLLPFHMACFVLAFLRDDSAEMQRRMQWAHGSPEESQIIEEAAWMAMDRGQANRARQLFTDARDNAAKAHLNEAAAKIEIDEAGLLADLGFPAEARKHLLAGLKLAPDTVDVEVYGAIALARVGDVQQAETIAAKVALQAPLDTLLQGAKLPAVRAAIQLKKHDAQGALRALEPARPFDLCIIMALTSPYYRGLAYLDAAQPKEAAVEFQRVIDHRALMPDSPYIALAQMQEGHSLALSGDRDHAAAAYRAADEMWKNADPDFPPHQQLRGFQRELSSSR